MEFVPFAVVAGAVVVKAGVAVCPIYICINYIIILLDFQSFIYF